MSHLIENKAYVGETPWRGLGVPIANNLSAKEMQKVCGADFAVRKYPEFIEIKKDERHYTGNFSLVRSDTNTVLDSVSEEWLPVQNDEAFEFFHEFVHEGDMEMHTAGVLDYGRRVWCMAKVKESFSLFRGKDRIESNLLFSSSHQYGKSTTVMSTPIRDVCNNTLQLALSGKSDMSVRVTHRRKFDPEVVKTTLRLNTKRLETYKEAAEFMASKTADPIEVLKFFSDLFPLTSNKNRKEGPSAISRNATALMEILETQPGAKLGAGTWWAPFNAATYFVDHLAGQNDNNRLLSAFFGVGRERKINALKLATNYAKVA